MSYDIGLLKAVSSKEHYTRFKDLVKKHNVSKITLDLFGVIGAYYDNYPMRDTLVFDEFKTFYYISTTSYKLFI